MYYIAFNFILENTILNIYNFKFICFSVESFKKVDIAIYIKTFFKNFQGNASWCI